MTKVYEFSIGQLNQLDSSQYNEQPEQQLLSEGYALLPNSIVGVSKTYTSNNRAIPYALFIANEDYRCIVFFHRLEDYISYFRQWGMLSHVMHFILPS